MYANGLIKKVEQQPTNYKPIARGIPRFFIARQFNWASSSPGCRIEPPTQGFSILWPHPTKLQGQFTLPPHANMSVQPDTW